MNLKPYRDLKADLELTTTATSYAGTGSSVSLATKATKPTSQERPKPKVTMSMGGSTGGVSAPKTSGKVVAASVIPKPAAPPHLGGDGSMPKKSDGSPDFSRMTAAQKVAFARRRIRNDITRNKEV
jgi:hypothetical protein